MKKARIAAFLMCIVMLFSFSGCNAISQAVKDTKAIIGTWTSAPIDQTAALNEELAASLPEEYQGYLVIDDFSFCLDLAFTEDGKYAMSANKESVDKLVAGMQASFTDGVTRLYTDMAAEYGLSIDDLVSANNYASLDELVADTLTGFDFDAMADEICKPLDIKGTFTLVNGVMYLASEDDPKTYNDIFNYTLDGDSLSLNVSEEYADSYSFDLPLNFTRTAA